MRQRQLVLLYILFFLLAASTIGIMMFEQPVQRIIRASSTDPSREKSLILADKILARPSDKVQITVFIRNDQGEALPNKSVQVRVDNGLLTSTTAITDDSGKAIFTLGSNGAEKSVVTASTEGIDVSNTITVYFTQQ
ncbi:hypothetical protein COU89_03605 [Candidatus Roizmanbacteria bacterium CG10_big_fil_rev_8_21_14_0_10_45_7]|uniref:Big-1 domain-containing protein n=1 Tax=Candidatus Roizmanbacteria bacterium CG10_big_fil_rev_8_21_14_0_10_45_7 TaxID=1974854 RepID=A0A2M8KU16_9BACT|nr:MAG: hypothetical protein COU89_03605 [Candidatus Roizmanbacteria bacterium CG10_big_fil_rev_8_21_14_0_10_45_7]